MKYSVGFTFVEMMIIICIIAILSLVALGPKTEFTGHNSDGTRCIAGFKFYQGKQMIGQNGGGIPCEITPTPR